MEAETSERVALPQLFVTQPYRHDRDGSMPQRRRQFSDAAWGPYDKAMKTTPSQSRITVDPGKCGGRPCIRHMRIRVKDVLEMLASGAGEDQILADYPDLEREDIRACLEYAAQYVDHPVFVG